MSYDSALSSPRTTENFIKCVFALGILKFKFPVRTFKPRTRCLSDVRHWLIWERCPFQDPGLTCAGEGGIRTIAQFPEIKCPGWKEWAVPGSTPHSVYFSPSSGDCILANLPYSLLHLVVLASSESDLSDWSIALTRGKLPNAHPRAIGSFPKDGLRL